MKSKKILYNTVVAVVSALALSSCNDFLDTMPDNRTTMDTEDKIADLLTNAYPEGNTILVNELMSDNTDYYGNTNPNGTRFGDEVYFWKDVMESSNDGPEVFWLEQYQSIAAANEAIVDINKLEKTNISSETRTKLEGDRAEALLLRAYGHFKLVTEFSKMYNPATADKDLGIPVSKKVETLTNKQDRGTVAEVYKAIDEDIQAALPIVTNNYDVPKYHFNRKAALAFAARFYLYYQKWDKVISYANEVLGSNPAAVLRDWKVMGKLARGFEAYNQHYISADLSCNLLLTTKQSEAGILLGPYLYYKRYSHGRYLGNMEDINAQNVWGAGSYYVKPFTGAGNNYDICQIWHTRLTLTSQPTKHCFAVQRLIPFSRNMTKLVPTSIRGCITRYKPARHLPHSSSRLSTTAWLTPTTMPTKWPQRLRSTSILPSPLMQKAANKRPCCSVFSASAA